MAVTSPGHTRGGFYNRWPPRLDGHPATLSWLGAVRQHRVQPLGVTGFGQSGDIPDLYRAYGLDADAILDAAARVCLG